MPHCDQRHRLSCSSYLTARPPCFAEIYSPWASTTPLRNPFKTPTSSSLSAAPGGQGGSLVLAEVEHQGERFPFHLYCVAATVDLCDPPSTPTAGISTIPFKSSPLIFYDYFPTPFPDFPCVCVGLLGSRAGIGLGGNSPK